MRRGRPLNVLLSPGLTLEDRPFLASDLRQRAKDLDVVIRRRLEQRRQQAKNAYDRFHKTVPHRFERGDWLFVQNNARVPGISKKHTPRYKGPYFVVSRVFDHDLAIKLGANEDSEIIIVSADRLKLFKSATQVRAKQKVLVDEEIVILPRPAGTIAGADGDSQAPGPISEFVWAKVPGYSAWPSRIITGAEFGRKEWPRKKWVKFFNDSDRVASVPEGRLFDYRTYRSSFFFKDAPPEIILAADQLESVAGLKEAPELLV